jgi:hypothetical protein
MGKVLQHARVEFVESRHQEADHMSEVGTDGGGSGIAPIAEILDRSLDLLTI